jgi:hypothetical protein
LAIQVENKRNIVPSSEDFTGVTFHWRNFSLAQLCDQDKARKEFEELAETLYLTRVFEDFDFGVIRVKNLIFPRSII